MKNLMGDQSHISLEDIKEFLNTYKFINKFHETLADEEIQDGVHKMERIMEEYPDYKSLKTMYSRIITIIDDNDYVNIKLNK